MHTYTLIYDSECPSCSKVAKHVHDLGIDSLGTASSNDRSLRANITEHGLSLPDKPSLLVNSDSKVRIYTGWRMRLQLAKVIGSKRASELIRLAWAEAQARQERKKAVNRRTLLGGAVAGAGAAITGAATAQAAPNSGASSVSSSIAEPLGADELSVLIDKPEVSRSAAVWGEVNRHDVARFAADDGDQVLVMSHGDDRRYATFLSETDPSVGVTVEYVPGEPTIRYFTPEGVPIAEFSTDGETVTSSQIASENVPASAQIGVQGMKEYAACLTLCLGGKVDAGCISACGHCATGSWINCGKCGLCAGGSGVRCAKDCKGFW
ncbi:hypothetical protein [Salininema proteolyticum]|uniref:Glutaredoxin domain-containing protein n=1 Tax=Salininema proteolyticum TaxID=1607685 RepID=A0ABV8TYC0_9ACTN